MTQHRPKRTLGGVHGEFWEHCGAGRLCLQQCEACAAYLWPPGERCEECGGQLAWQPVSGTGTLVSWSVFHQRYYPELAVPWETILVELTEGPLFVSNPRGFTHADAVPGQAVRVEFLECHDENGPFSLPVFVQDPS
jgi:uncharacterized OB-fold protein